MATLLKGHKTDNFQSYNSLKLSFTNTQGLSSNFVESKSFLESNSPDILALYETSLDDAIDSGSFPSIHKDCVTHMHGLAVCVKEGLPFAQDLSLENFADSNLCFRLALLHSVSYFFFLYRLPSLKLCTAFDGVSSNMDEVISINPSANVFVFGDLNIPLLGLANLEITFFVCTNKNLLNLKQRSDRLVIIAKGFLKLPTCIC